MGGGVGTTPGYGLSIADYDPSDTEIDPVTGKTKKKKKQSEDCVTLRETNYSKHIWDNHSKKGYPL